MTNIRSPRNSASECFALLALGLTFILRYAPFLTSRLLFAPVLDNVYLYGPIFSEVSRLALAGAVPYYLPDIGTGFPVFESPHFSIIYPFYFFGLLNYGGPLASLYTLTNVTLLHIFVFYVNLYVLLRCATTTPWASYIGASVGMLASNTGLYASWIARTASCAWLPLVLAGAVLLLRFPGKACGILVFSIAAGLLALSASQPVIHAALMCLILFIAGVVWMCLQQRYEDIWRVAWSLVVCSGIAFGLAGVAILPMYIATGEMIRQVGDAAVIGYAQIPWKNFTLYQLTLSQAIYIVIKPTWRAVVGSPYVGPLGVMGVLLTGIYFRRLDPFLRMLAVTFGAISLYGLLSGFGTNLGLAYVNFHLPFINLIREATRHLVLFVIGVSFLSGLGYSLLAQSFEEYKQRRNARPLIPPAVLMLIFGSVIFWELFHNNYAGASSRFSIVAAAPVLFVLGSVWKLPGYKNVVSAAVLVSAAAVVIPVRGFSVSESRFLHETGFNNPMNLLSHRVIQSFANKIDAADYRVDFRDKTLSHWLWAMNGSYYRIKSFYNSLNPQPYGQFHFSLLTNVPHLRAMMGARYVLCGPDNLPTDAGAKQILETEGYRLYENPHPMGRLTLLHRVAGPAKSEDQFVKTISKGFDYLSEAYVDDDHFEAARRFLDSSRVSPHAKDRIVKIANQANSNYSVVKSHSPSLLVLNEWFTPAWKVRVNGRKQSVLRVNEWQTGVLLPAGKNRVEFEYRPTLFWVLMVLNRITATLLAIFVIFTVSRKRGMWGRASAKLRHEP